MLTTIIVLSIACLVLSLFAFLAVTCAFVVFSDSKDNEQAFKSQLQTEQKLLKLASKQIYKYRGLWELHKEKSTNLRIQLHALKAKINGDREIKED